MPINIRIQKIELAQYTYIHIRDLRLESVVKVTMSISFIDCPKKMGKTEMGQTINVVTCNSNMKWVKHGTVYPLL